MPFRICNDIVHTCTKSGTYVLAPKGNCTGAKGGLYTGAARYSGTKEGQRYMYASVNNVECTGLCCERHISAYMLH